MTTLASTDPVGSNKRIEPRPRSSSWLFVSIVAICVVAAVTIGSIASARTTTKTTTTSTRIGRSLTTRTSEGGSAIVILLPAIDADVENCCIALKSLKYLPGDRDSPPEEKAPVLLFNEGGLTSDQMERLETCTDRTVAFPVITALHDRFPVGFADVDVEWRHFLTRHGLKRSIGRPPYFSYANMIAFWTRWLWEHPAVQQFDTVMRLDTDSCFLPDVAENPGLSRLPDLDERYVYQSVVPDVGMTGSFLDERTGEWGARIIKKNMVDVPNNPYCVRKNKDDYIVGLYDHVLDYAKRENIEPTNKGMWDATVSGWEQYCSLHTFQTNFEIVRREFFLSSKVLRWHRALVGALPFGTYRYRWGDAQTRFLTMSLFAPEGSVLSTTSKGYAHGKDMSADGHPYRCRTAAENGAFD